MKTLTIHPVGCEPMLVHPRCEYYVLLYGASPPQRTGDAVRIQYYRPSLRRWKRIMCTYYETSPGKGWLVKNRLQPA